MENFKKTEKAVNSKSIRTFSANNVEFGRKPVPVKIKRKPCTGNCERCDSILC